MRVLVRDIIHIYIFAGLLMLAACGGSGASKAAPADSEVTRQADRVMFDADSAYAFVGSQVSYGPRVPNTAAHRECGEWLVSKLRQYGAADVNTQRATVTAYDGTPLAICNISASFNPAVSKRILLLSHWDSRPWADQEADPELREKPIDGANDGASGVAVILELARLMSEQLPKTGVDVLFVDAEDYGGRADDAVQAPESSWCLGTQYWVSSPTLPLERIRYAILLDMVGGKDAVFPREYFSNQGARDITDQVWAQARRSGYGGRFVDRQGAPVIDDHLYLLKAGIPAIDIIETQHPETGSFNPAWHTHADNIDNIDAATLAVVGQTLTDLIYGQ